MDVVAHIGGWISTVFLVLFLYNAGSIAIFVYKFVL